MECLQRAASNGDTAAMQNINIIKKQ